MSYVHFRGASSVSMTGDRSWSMLPNMVYSELFFLKEKCFVYRFLYLVEKFSESLGMIFLIFVFNRDDKSKISFFKNRCALLFKFSFEYLFKGNKFYESKFHQRKTVSLINYELYNK